MTRAAAPVHAVPIGEAMPRDHRASSTCWCQPRQAFRDLSTSAVVFVHRNARVADRVDARPGGAT
jgi:hypothetical protein